jgi:hypothetical protein
MAAEIYFRLDFSDALLNVFEHGLCLVEFGLLHENAHRISGAQLGFTVARGVEPGHDLEDGRLAGTVRAHDTNLGAREERHRDVIEDDLVAHRFAGLDHGVDEFSHRNQPTGARSYARRVQRRNTLALIAANGSAQQAAALRKHSQDDCRGCRHR